MPNKGSINGLYAYNEGGGTAMGLMADWDDLPLPEQSHASNQEELQLILGRISALLEDLGRFCDSDLVVIESAQK